MKSGYRSSSRAGAVMPRLSKRDLFMQRDPLMFCVSILYMPAMGLLIFLL